MVDFQVGDADLSLAAMFAGWAMADELQARLGAEGFDDLRFADGVMFQHLVGAERTIGELADRLGVTQQAVSKAVADLGRRGYVLRQPDRHDGRVRRIALSQRGAAAVERGRVLRAAIGAELAAELGPRRVEAARKVLVEAVRALGADAAVRGRRVRPPL
jgi:DNA-binding MarR family transcriptional regulator